MINGAKRRYNKFYKKMEQVYKHFYALMSLFHSPTFSESNGCGKRPSTLDYQEMNENCCCWPNFYQALVNIRNSFYWTLMCIVGLPYHKSPELSIELANEQIEFERNQEFIQKFQGKHNLAFFDFVAQSGHKFLGQVSKLYQEEMRRQPQQLALVQNQPPGKKQKYEVLFSILEKHFSDKDCSPKMVACLESLVLALDIILNSQE